MTVPSECMESSRNRNTSVDVNFIRMRVSSKVTEQNYSTDQNRRTTLRPSHEVFVQKPNECLHLVVKVLARQLFGKCYLAVFHRVPK